MAPTMASKDSVEERYIQLQIIEQQMNQLQQQIRVLDSQLVELNNTKSILDDLKNSKVGSEIMASIAPGIFVKGELKDNEELLLNVGSDVLVKKDVEGAKKLLDQQADGLKKAHEQMLHALQELFLQAQKLEEELQNV